MFPSQCSNFVEILLGCSLGEVDFPFRGTSSFFLEALVWLEVTSDNEWLWDGGLAHMTGGWVWVSPVIMVSDLVLGKRWDYNEFCHDGSNANEIVARAI
ncbi:hypothetical protein V6N11_076870 [Hibiscus sabdariffa]|uniref:Uncharacterized protein n=1 Tax=Hibiscus sabdariffa TaxID=183260 RepID=A0ABR2TBC9_9ROSI